MEACSWDVQPWFCLYAEAKQWQAGIAALIGFLGLIGAALYNFRLNRRRDKQLRDEEMVSVATALYGEILLLREELALLARIVAHWEIRNEEIREIHQFTYTPSLPSMYPALAHKIGLLPSELLLGITQFYANVANSRRGLEIYYRTRTGEGPRYSAGSLVLKDAVGGVYDVKPVLRKIEQLASIPEAKDPDTGRAEAVLEEERFQFEWTQEEPERPKAESE